MKRLILDRGFLDGEQIGRCKKDYGIDVLIPLKKNMDVYQDALGLMRGNRVRFEPYTHPAAKPPVDPKPRHVPAEIRRREKETSGNAEPTKEELNRLLLRTRPWCAARWPVERTFRSWSSCPVPLSVIVNQEIFADGHEEIWMLVDTKDVKIPLRHETSTGCGQRLRNVIVS